MNFHKQIPMFPVLLKRWLVVERLKNVENLQKFFSLFYFHKKYIISNSPIIEEHAVFFIIYKNIFIIKRNYIYILPS